MSDFEFIRNLLDKNNVGYETHPDFPKDFIILTENEKMFVFKEEKLVCLDEIPPKYCDF